MGLPPRVRGSDFMPASSRDFAHYKCEGLRLVGDVDWRVPTGAHEKKGNAGRGGRDAWMLNVRHGIGDVINFVYS